jgi:membrane protease YdiL (CAAX protease family)
LIVDVVLQFWIIGGGAAWAIVAVAFFRRAVPIVESRVLTRGAGARCLLGAAIGIGLLALVLAATGGIAPFPKAVLSLVAHAGAASFLIGFSSAIEPGREVLGLSAAGAGRDLARGAAVYLLFIPAVAAAHVLNSWFAGKDAETVRRSVHNALTDPGPARIALVLNLVLAVPLFEEVVFRGLLQQGVNAQLALVVPPRTSRFLAVALASVAFTALHEPATFFPVFVLSLLLGAAYDKSGRLLVPVALHATHNLAVVVYDSLQGSCGAAP